MEGQLEPSTPHWCSQTPPSPPTRLSVAHATSLHPTILASAGGSILITLCGQWRALLSARKGTSSKEERERERERERESLGLHLRDGNALLDPRGLSPSHTRHTHVHVCASCPPSGVSSTLHLVPLSLSSGFWLSQASPFQHRGSSTTRLVAAVVESMQRPRTGPIGKITTFRYKVGVRVSCFSFTKTRISWAAATADDTT